MRRSLRVVLWIGAFGTALAIGAYLGAHSNPFGPEVQGSGPPSTVSPTGSPIKQGPQRWRATMKSATYHQLYVGGRCDTSWKTTLTFTVDDLGSVSGKGTADRVGDLSCDFVNPQINTDSYTVRVAGSFADGALTLRLIETDSRPAGSSDYGGFEHTVFAGSRSEIVVQIGDAAAAKTRVNLERIDAEARGTYYSSNVVAAHCRNCVGG